MSDVHYDSVSSSSSGPGHYLITHTNWVDHPGVSCKFLKTAPCPAGKTSYWRSFATDLKDGGCGQPKKICGARNFERPPHFVVEPANRSDLIKFF
jgi:hypothetical protein